MTKKEKKLRQTYSSELKAQVAELAREIGAANTAQKLGVENVQTLWVWVRHDKKLSQDSDYQELERLKAENKRLKKELEVEKRSVNILKTATAFFCQDQVK